jgi:mono/diheme cytochrome c family protein
VDIVGLSILVVLLIVFAALAVRAWRAERLWVRLLGGIPATLVTLVLGAAAVAALVGYGKINATYPNPVRDVTVAGTPEQIAQGEKLARTCTGCHSSTGNLPLNGQNFAEGGPPIGVYYAPNLTPAHLKEWSDGEIIRAIREGVNRNGNSLIIMPSSAFKNLSDEDVQAVVAYLRSQPAVEPNTPPRQISVVGAIMVATLFPPEVFSVQPPITEPVVAPPAGPTAEYGQYLTRLGCQDCHGQTLEGGAPGGEAPAGPNLVAFAHEVDEATFVKTLRTGIKPDGQPLSEEMPGKDYEKLSDDDFRAMYRYLAAR